MTEEIRNGSKWEPCTPIPVVRTRFWNSFPEIATDIQRGFDEHGDLIRLRGFFARVYCLRDPVHIETLFKDPKIGIAKLPAVFPRLKALMPTSVVANRGDQAWSPRRKQVQVLFNRTYMDRYAEITIEHARQHLVDSWGNIAGTNEAFELYGPLQKFLTRLGFDLFFSLIPHDDEIAELDAKLSFIESQFPQRLPPLLPTSSDRKVRQYSGELREFLKRLLRARRQESHQPDDLIAFLLQQNDAATGSPFTEDSAVDQMIELFTSIRLVAPPLGLGLRMIAENRHVQERMIDEARHVMPEGLLSMDSLASLRYHQMTISEIFRLYPSALALPRWCEDGISLGSFSIPPRSVVAPMIFHTHRNPNVFADPLTFDPLRWCPETRENIPHYAQLGFGAGKRTCLGVHLALMIMRVLTASIFQRFRLIPHFEDQWRKGEVELRIHPSKGINVGVEDLDAVPKGTRERRGVMAN